jgi:hypothetical protein
MRLRIGRKSDGAKSVLFEQPARKYLQAVAVGAGWPVGIAADDQRMIDGSFAGRAGEKVVELTEAREVSSRYVRHGHQPRATKPGCNRYHLVRRAAGEMRDVDDGASGEHVLADRYCRSITRRQLDGSAAHALYDGAPSHPFGAFSCRRIRHAESRLREMT